MTDGALSRSVTLQTVPSEFQYTLIGLYSDSANPDPNERFGVSVTLDTDFLGMRVGSEFADVFTGSSEADLITALSSNDTDAIKVFSRTITAADCSWTCTDNPEPS